MEHGAGVALSIRILVVDDDLLVLRSVERILSRGGYETVTAVDVDEAVRYASKLSMHAALVDYDLTHDTGLSVLARLREIQPSCLRILMTGSDDFPMVVEAVNRGEVLRVVRKPFEPSEILDTLRDAFASARRMVQLATSQLRAVDMRERQMLEDCMSAGLLRLAVQPIVTTKGNRVAAYEALLRSSHPILDNPLAILQVAERHARIADLGQSVFHLAEGWLKRIPEPCELFVNLHPAQLADPDRLAADLKDLIPHSARITMEITERSRLYDIDRWESAVDMLTDAGFSLAIDDLGAGYNSLTMLAELQPRYIKLDMSLVRRIHKEPRKQRLVQLMSTFADATNALTIAEGVETAEEAATLLDCGVHLLQGYYFAPPDTEAPPLIENVISDDRARPE
ncbi:MAG: EAL domain-containing protein [Proteobacteria bacterium]|nr:EAL domain-containing protein [Pseudomonadota bacterium]